MLIVQGLQTLDLFLESAGFLPGEPICLSESSKVLVGTSGIDSSRMRPVKPLQDIFDQGFLAAA